MKSPLFVGCQGWSYEDWVSGPPGTTPIFYPYKTKSQDMLELYCRAFNTVEVDSTAYGPPVASTIDGWRERTPGGFRFSLKMPSSITHQAELSSDTRFETLEFCERARGLGEKLGCIVIQLPPRFTASSPNYEALRNFLEWLPTDLQFCIEFRDSSWTSEATAKLLREKGIALVVSEGPWIDREKLWELALNINAGFHYFRWMGERDLTRYDVVQRSRSNQIAEWSRRLKSLLSRGEELYCYFSNFYEGHAPASANRLKMLMGAEVFSAPDLEDQPSLF